MGGASTAIMAASLAIMNSRGVRELCSTEAAVMSVSVSRTGPSALMNPPVISAGDLGSVRPAPRNVFAEFPEQQQGEGRDQGPAELAQVELGRAQQAVEDVHLGDQHG